MEITHSFLPSSPLVMQHQRYYFTLQLHNQGYKQSILPQQLVTLLHRMLKRDSDQIVITFELCMATKKTKALYQLV